MLKFPRNNEEIQKMILDYPSAKDAPNLENRGRWVKYIKPFTISEEIDFFLIVAVQAAYDKKRFCYRISGTSEKHNFGQLVEFNQVYFVDPPTVEQVIEIREKIKSSTNSN